LVFVYKSDYQLGVGYSQEYESGHLGVNEKN
jgi:hypothetical protein